MTSFTIDAAPQVAPEAALAADIQERLSHLYRLAQRSNYVFASPLGPFVHALQQHDVPRFVYFGPHTSDRSLRLAFHAGFNSKDFAGSLALLALVERLATEPTLGHGLNLSFFPLVDVRGVDTTKGTRDLSGEHWGFSHQPEIALLEKDARRRAYHGFVRVTTTSDEIPVVRLSSREPGAGLGAELISSDDIAPWPVRFEVGRRHALSGPLTLADDLPVQPFELTLALPSSWAAATATAAAQAILTRFVVRYRGLQAYAEHI